MGQDHHDHRHEKTNPHAIPEPDQDLPLRIRSIDFIKHNPNLYHVSIFDLGKDYQLLGGHAWLASTLFGAAFGNWYFSTKARLLGAAIGGWVGYIRFGDRQRIHNAWVSERLRRRYPESKNLDVKDLWRFKGIKASQHYYKWT